MNIISFNVHKFKKMHMSDLLCEMVDYMEHRTNYTKEKLVVLFRTINQLAKTDSLRELSGSYLKKVEKS